MLDESRQLAIELIMDGTLTKTEIAKRCGKSRRWIYDILQEEEVKAELHRLAQEIQLHSDRRLIANLEKAITNVVFLADHAKSEKVRLAASVYLIDRKMGKPSSKLDISTNDNDKTGLEDDILAQEFEEFKEAIESIEE